MPTSVATTMFFARFLLFLGVLAFLVDFKTLESPLDGPVSGTNNGLAVHRPASRDRNTWNYDSKYECLMTVPSSLPSRGTERTCKQKDRTRNSSRPQKIDLDKCCQDLDTMLRHTPYFCGPNGALKCYYDEDTPVCTCTMGLKGSTCNETISEQVNCTCYPKSILLTSGLGQEFVNCYSADKVYGVGQCYLQIADSICQCDSMKGEINGSLSLCTDDRNSSIIAHSAFGQTDSRLSPVVVATIVAVIAVVLIAFVILYFVFRRRKMRYLKAKQDDPGQTDESRVPE